MVERPTAIHRHLPAVLDGAPSPRFYERGEVRTALASYDFRTFFRLVRLELKVSQRELGIHIGLSQARVSEYERGARRLTQIDVVAGIARALNIPAELLGFTSPGHISPRRLSRRGPQPPAPVDRRDVLTAAAQIVVGAETRAPNVDMVLPEAPAHVPGRLEHAELDRVEQLTAEHRRLDDRVAGHLPTIDAHAGWVVRAVESSAYAPGIRDRTLIAAADLTALAGWMHYDVDEHDMARRLWLVALQAARDAPRVDLVCEVLRMMAHQALHQHEPSEALQLIHLAQMTLAAGEPRDTISPAVRLLTGSQLAAHQGWCYAALGRPRDARAALAQARDTFQDAQRLPRPPVPWLRSFDRTELTALHGHALHVLARTQSNDVRAQTAAEAVPLLQSAVLNRSGQQVRGTVLDTIGLATALLDVGDRDHGIAVGQRALRLAQALPSRRILDRLATLGSATHRYTDPATTVFREQLSTHRSVHARSPAGTAK